MSDKNIATITITATLRPARKKKCEQCLPTVGATPSPLFTLSKEKQNDDISYEQAINEINPAEQMRKCAVALKELRHQPVNIVIERLFVQGEFNTLTERHGEYDHFYFQMFCDATDEDYFWFERICIGRFKIDATSSSPCCLPFTSSRPLGPLV